MKLFVDVGNTALKWRVRDGQDTWQGGGRHERRWDEVVDTIDVAVGCEAVWVASVAGADSDGDIAKALERKTGAAPQFYYSQAVDFGVTSCYPEPRRLGADRWVAMVECYQRYGSGIIVDCGSALTIDAVDAGGQFLGGYIVPGLGMLRGALLRDTADVHVEAGAAGLGLGQSTGECVHNGLLRMSVAFVTEVVLELRQVLDDTCKVLITGGDAPALIDAFGFDYTHVPDLVLDGLERIAAEQE